MGFFERIAANLRRLAQEPIDAELTRAQRMLRFAVDLARHGGRQLQKDRAMDMAAALTYYTIFSLVPMATSNSPSPQAGSSTSIFPPVQCDKSLADR